MEKISDNEIIDELKRRFIEKDMALQALRVVNEKIEKINNSLLESERVKSDFLSNIRNEINNPLGVIIGLSSQLVKTSFEEEDRYQGIARMIHSEAMNLDFQIRNIFAAAELESGEAIVEKSKADIESILQDVLQGLQSKIEESDFDISIHKASLPPVFLDAEKLHLLISNLVSNAVEFNRPGGRIDIYINCEDNRFIFTIKDEGTGISVEERERIFDRFRQLDAGMTKGHRGHGLGLSVVKALVELLQGTISVESLPGKGSAFTLTIPLLEEKEEIETSSLFGNEFIFDDEEEKTY